MEFILLFRSEYKTKFEAADIVYAHRLIDDQVAQAIKSEVREAVEPSFLL
jgi:isocitrate dehydrogenase